ncbi:MAG: hypothetical protein RL367_1276, partial [Pseudomonadota bacterium]
MQRFYREEVSKIARSHRLANMPALGDIAAKFAKLGKT